MFLKVAYYTCLTLLIACTITYLYIAVISEDLSTKLGFAGVILAFVSFFLFFTSENRSSKENIKNQEAIIQQLNSINNKIGQINGKL